MVGVPGKSKGCSTCRQRKKGCDQARPVCGQCKHSGYKCGGYKRDLTFIHHPASKAVENAIFTPLPTRNPDLKILPYPLEQSANDVQWKSLFWDLYMPHGVCIVRDVHILRCGHPMNWTYMVQELSNDEPSLELAFSAVSISRVGRDHQDARLVKESTKLYGKALKDLQDALYDPERMFTDEVLTACMLLGLYEVYEGSAQKSFGWISHTQGAARLVELRGAERHIGWQAHHVFLGARVPVLYAAMLQRKASFMGTHEWLTVPWQGHVRTGLDRLVDVMATIPALLQQIDIVSQIRDPVKAHQRQTQVLEACRTTEAALHRWRSRMKEAAHPIITKDEEQSSTGYPFKHTISFQNHLFVHANIIYWTCCIIICEAFQDIHQLLEPQIPIDQHPRPPDIVKEALAWSCATNIAQSILFCLTLEMGALGANIISFPMGIAFRFFQKRQESQICTWFVKTVADMKSRGLHVGRFMDTFAADAAPKPSNENATNFESLANSWRLQNNASQGKPATAADVSLAGSAVPDSLSPSSTSYQSLNDSGYGSSNLGTISTRE